MMDISYAVTPFLAWLVTGCAKFTINSIVAKRLAFDLIGYGGLPSNHSAIVSSMAGLIALRVGIDTPVFGLAVTLAFIVVLDALSLRKQIGKHATAINKHVVHTDQDQHLRERMGHTLIEVGAGVVVGLAVAYAVYFFTI